MSLLTAVTALLLLVCRLAGATSAADQAHYERALSTAIDEVADWWLPEAEEDEEDRRGVAIEPFGDPDIADITDIADIPTLPTFRHYRHSNITDIPTLPTLPTLDSTDNRHSDT